MRRAVEINTDLATTYYKGGVYMVLEVLFMLEICDIVTDYDSGNYFGSQHVFNMLD